MRYVLTGALLLIAGSTPTAQDPDVATLVARIGAFFVEQESRLTGVIAEERQTQRQLTSSGKLSKERILVSDAMFVTVGDSVRYFRDVISVDGRPVRNREERLRNLFVRRVRDPIAQARAIFDESGRHDLKLPHWSSALLLPTLVIKPANHGRFRFAAAEGGLAFDEVASPSLARAGMPLKDQPMRGTLTIDPASGALRAATLGARNDTFDGFVEVRYGSQTGPAALVPVHVSETYRLPFNPKNDYLEITSEYSNIRRFEVSVEQTIELPK